MINTILFKITKSINDFFRSLHVSYHNIEDAGIDLYMFYSPKPDVGEPKRGYGGGGACPLSFFYYCHIITILKCKSFSCAPPMKIFCIRCRAILPHSES